MDFTLKTYKTLFNTLKNQCFSFQTFQDYIKTPEDKVIMLRHDVDKLPENSLQFAQIQHELGIKGTYFFRIVPESFNAQIIEKVASLGHEIGYHYEDVDLAIKSIKNEKVRINNEKVLIDKAIELFEKHLVELRKYYQVETICMHGSPLSKYDNKLLWKYYNYKDFGIIGEPYFDVDFSETLYLTDTGRKWNGEKVSVRDKVLDSNHQFKKTSEIIYSAENGILPNQIMFTFHPQRWTDKPLPWIKEFVWQNSKNVAKYFLTRIRK